MRPHFGKKAIAIAIWALLLVAYSSQITYAGENQTENEDLLIEDNEHSIELVDQSNGGSGCGGCDGASSVLLTEEFMFAQSFTPSHNILSKISLFFQESGFPPEEICITLSVRSSLDGDDLTSVESSIQYGNVEFDFEDIAVVSGDTYYMICSIEGTCTPSNGYSWPYTTEDHYPKGAAYIAQGSAHFVENEGADMSFKTYWRDFGPDIPLIDGPIEGNAQQRYDYSFTTTDPEGDDVFYYIEWGDGRTIRWIGPYESGEMVTKNHQWAEQGEYTIRVKAKDIYGVETDWMEYQIALPKEKSFFSTFRIFLENHPFFLPLLQTLLAI